MNRLGEMQKKIVYALLFGIIFTATFFVSGTDFPRPLILDDSAFVALEYAQLHRFGFGRDIIFTYGPLGFLSVPVSQGHFIAARVLFAVFWSTIVASSSLLFISRLQGVAKYLFILWIILFPYDRFLDPFIPLVLCAGACLILGNSGKGQWPVMAACCIFALLAMIKFTFCFTALLVVMVCLSGMILKKNYRAALITGVASAFFFSFLWILSGQQISNFLPWLRNSMEISDGYSRTMSLVPGTATLWIGCTLLVINAALLLDTLYRSERDFSAVSYVIITQLFVFMTWKYGFVRADYNHILTFLHRFPLLAGILLATPYTRTVGRQIFPQLCFGAIVFLSLAMAQNERIIDTSNLSIVRAGYEKIRQSVRTITVVLSGEMESLFPDKDAEKSETYTRYSMLPALAAITGTDPVDVMNCTQIFALANGMNYFPRPVIQGYAAYTPHLQQLNGKFIRNQREPSFVLYLQQTIDNRFPTLDDSAAFNAILKNYLPVNREGDYLLMEKNGSEAVTYTLIHEQKLQFGELLNLSRWNNEPLFLTVDMKRTISGRVTTLLYQESPLFMRVQADTGTYRFRYIPVMGELPFLLSPLITDNHELLDFYYKLYRSRVNSVVFMKPEGLSRQYEDTFTVRLSRAQFN